MRTIVVMNRDGRQNGGRHLVPRRAAVLYRVKQNSISEYQFLHTANATSGQVWRYTPGQRVAASTLRRYSFGLRLAIAQVDARPVMSISFI